MPRDSLNDKVNKLNSIRNDSAKLMAASIEERFAQFASRIASGGGSNTANNSYDYNKLSKLIAQVRGIQVTDDYRVVTYPGINKLYTGYGLAPDTIFEYTLSRIKDHISKNFSWEFDSGEIVGNAIALAIKKCAKRGGYRIAKIDDFKREYQLSVFGDTQRRYLLPDIRGLTISATNLPLILNFINNKLINRHIANLQLYYSKFSNMLKQLQSQNSEVIKYSDRYTTAVETAIRSTLMIYRAMYSVYYSVGIEYSKVFNELIAIDRKYHRGYNESLEYSASFIRPSMKLLTECANELTNLNEGATPFQISESFIKFRDEFTKLANEDKDYRISKYKEFENIIGTELLDIDKLSIPKNAKCTAYENINKPINIDKYRSWLDKNSEILNTNIKQYNNKNEALDISFLLLDEFKSFYNDSIDDNSSLNILLTSVSSYLCGKYTSICPDLRAISENVVWILDLMKIINSHIDYLTSLVAGNPDDCCKFDGNFVIGNKNIFKYLSVILVIYKNLIILMESSIDTIRQLKASKEDIY